MNERIDRAKNVLNAYIAHYDTKLETMKGSGMKNEKVVMLYFSTNRKNS